MLNRQWFELGGKVALITGAARGIGFETATALHARGASVVITDLDQGEADAAAERICGGDGTVIGIAADATDSGAMERVVDGTVERFESIDVCIPNAGIAPTTVTLRSIDRDMFERVVEVNLLGVWRTVRAAMPHVIAAKGQFLLIASAYAFFNDAFATPYAASKAGVEQLGRALRVELAVHGVHTGVVYLGFIDTEMVRSTFDRDTRGMDFAARVPLPLRRRMNPDEVGVLLADALERRKARVVAPRPWVPLFFLRGLSGPMMDYLLALDRNIRRLVGKYESSDSGSP